MDIFKNLDALKNLEDAVVSIVKTISKQNEIHKEEFKIISINFNYGEIEDEVEVTYIQKGEEKEYTFYLMK